MIPRVNKIGRSSEHSEPNGTGGSTWPLWPPSGYPRGQSPLRKFLGSKTHLDWLKIGLNLAQKNNIYIFENTPEKGWGGGEEGRGNSGALVITLLNLVSMLHANTSSPDIYCWTWLNRQEPLEQCHRYPNTLSRTRHNAKLDRVIQLNCGEVRTYVSCKTTRTQESFNHRGTKMFLLSDELWLITNNSKRIANGGKSISLSNLAHPSHLEK